MEHWINFLIELSAGLVGVFAGGTFCVYNAPDEELIREHARITGFPCNNIIQIKNIIDPDTGRD